MRRSNTTACTGRVAHERLTNAHVIAGYVVLEEFATQDEVRQLRERAQAIMDARADNAAAAPEEAAIFSTVNQVPLTNLPSVSCLCMSPVQLGLPCRLKPSAQLLWCSSLITCACPEQQAQTNDKFLNSGTTVDLFMEEKDQSVVNKIGHGAQHRPLQLQS